MKRLLFGITILGLIFFSGNKSYAQEVNPGMLPTNPFYFVKKFSWGIQRAFTFNKLRRFELELKISDQQAAEIRKLEELGLDLDVIQSAGEEYEANLRRLKTSLEELNAITSNSLSVQKILNAVNDRLLEHQEFLDALSSKNESVIEPGQ